VKLVVLFRIESGKKYPHPDEYSRNINVVFIKKIVIDRNKAVFFQIYSNRLQLFSQ